MTSPKTLGLGRALRGDTEHRSEVGRGPVFLPPELGLKPGATATDQ